MTEASESYDFRTAFVELARANMPVVLRVGDGQGTAKTGGAFQGSGAIVRLGLAARMRADRTTSFVLALDGFAGVSGMYRPHGAYSLGTSRSFRPVDLQLAVAVRFRFHRD